MKAKRLKKGNRKWRKRNNPVFKCLPVRFFNGDDETHSWLGESRESVSKYIAQRWVSRSGRLVVKNISGSMALPFQGAHESWVIPGKWIHPTEAPNVHECER